LLSTAGEGLCFLIITILIKLGQNNGIISKASIALFFMCYISFGIGMLGVPWSCPTEINSLPMKTKGAAVSTATSWYSMHTFMDNIIFADNSM